jgi:hypothetical protein
MAHATVGGKRHEVRVIKDLGDNWSIEVFPPPDARKAKTSEPFKPHPASLCLKIYADTREDALLHGLEHMQKLGKIEAFHLEANERPNPAAAKTDKPDEDEAAAEE